MNRNKKMTKKLAVTVAGMMAVQAGVLPVYAAADNSVSKEETVYVKADATGAAQEVIVSDWLKNSAGKAALEDQSDLKNIENVKGEESFSSNGKQLTWNANGQDIYYQGNSSKELPIAVRTTYYLDGKEVSPEELAGKSGHLKIRYAYENRSKSGEIYTPFTMATGLILPSEHFRNVKVDNGKVISDGEKEIVVGIGLPGMAKNLKLEETEFLKDVELPEAFEVDADVTDCKLTMAMTVAIPLNLDALGLDEIEGMDDLTDLLEELTDAATKLVDGSGELADGVKTLQDACTELIDGMNSVDENMGTLTDGITTLNSKKDDLTSGIQALADGIGTLDSKKGTLVQGVSDLASGATELRKGSNSVKKGSRQLAKSSKELEAGAKELAGGEGSKQLTAGSKTLVEGSSQLAAGSRTLADGITALVEGEEGKQLLAGGQTLVAGSQELAENLADYTAGVDSITQGLPAYVDGVGQYMQSVQNYVGAVNGLLDGITAGGTSTASTDGQTQESPSSDAQTPMQPSDMEIQAAQAQLQTTEAYGEPVVKSEEQVTKTTINEEAVAKIQTVLTNLEGVRSAVNAATTKEDLLRLYASYDQYMAELNDCIDLLGGALDGIQEETIDTVTVEQTVKVQNVMAAPENPQESDNGNTGSTAGQQMDQTALAQTAALLRGAGAQLTQGKEVQTLQAGAASLKDGAALLGAKEPETGATPSQRLNAGATQLAEGAAALNGGVGKVFSLAQTQLKPGADALASGLVTLNAGAEALDGGLAQLLGGAQTLDDNLQKFAAATSTLAAGSDTLYSGAKQLENGAGQLNSGAAVLSAGIGQLADGSGQLVSGAGELASGVQQLADGSVKLKDGTAQLASGGGELEKGVGDLKEGADELRDGMKEFNEKGIEKITDFLDEDVQELLDRLEAVQSAGNDYKLFSDSGDMDGNVKFIIETAGIE